MKIFICNLETSQSKRQKGVFYPSEFDLNKEWVGCGNFGKVYKAQHAELNNIVVKILSLGSGSRAEIETKQKK